MVVNDCALVVLEHKLIISVNLNWMLQANTVLPLNVFVI